VSYVMNNTPHQVIPETTRQRVLTAAVELGYTPSAAARMLVSGRSDVVLLLLPDWPIGLGVASLLDELSQAFAQHDLTFVIHPQVAARPITELWKSIIPAAILAYESFDESDLTAISRSGAELVIISDLDHGAQAMDRSVERTGRIQVEHLARAGHRHVGYAWPDNDRVLFFARHRLDGVRAACAERGLSEPLVRTVPLTADGGAAAIADWRAREPSVTAICAFNDEVALAVLAGARQLGISVPDDLAVIGVDDIPAAALAAPPLTTVATNITVNALDIVDAVVSKLDGRSPAPRPRQDADRVVARLSV
jgi:DNA-binding LacI/PurR family transcriptional regulator